MYTNNPWFTINEKFAVERVPGNWKGVYFRLYQKWCDPHSPDYAWVPHEKCDLFYSPDEAAHFVARLGA